MDKSNDAGLDEANGVSCTLQAFTHNDQLLEYIETLYSGFSDDRLMEITFEKLTNILNKYQEQPHLLDPFLDSFLEKLVNIVRNEKNEYKLKTKAFKFIRLISNVRGYKAVVRRLPHEVADLEPVVSMLENENNELASDWEASYVLLLWLSIIVKIPFHMSRLDGDATGDKTVISRIFRICLKFLVSSNATSSAATHLTACFFTRSDVISTCLQDLLNWAFTALSHSDDRTAAQDRECVAALSAIGAILKHGRREDMLPHAQVILNKVLKCNYKLSKNTLLRKCGIKVVQRIGLTFLKPKIATWRYQRGARSIADNLKVSDVPAVPKLDVVEDNEDDVDIPEEIEEVIEELMQCLKDGETIIRWSAAKGIGRVTGRLPCELGDEVVGTLLELVSGSDSDSAWHGVCLALAELGRRGLLLPRHLPRVLPLILRALIYEDSRGYFSIGDHVRDAACYVAWSFARAYDPIVLKPHVQELASGLLVVALFDREVKCRKAAAAAFQEHVGRQGVFPHGIDIVTAADYFTVAVRHNAYLNISVYVAGFSEYTVPLITHLVQRKVSHWDVAVRELAASALHALTSKDPKLVAEVILPKLLEQMKSTDLNTRHGALLASAQIIHSLHLLKYKINSSVIKAISQILPHYNERFYLNGMGGEMLRQAVCFLIKKCSESKLKIDASVVDSWQKLLDECLLHEVVVIRQRAAEALAPFFAAYRLDISAINRNALIDRYLKGLSTGNQTARSGICAALSALPCSLLRPRLADVVTGLVDALRITEITVKWAEARRDCLNALIIVVTRVGIAALLDPHQEWDATVATNVGTKTRLLSEVEPNTYLLSAVFDALLVCLKEYTQDARGDIGAWVREAAMSGCSKLITAVADLDESLVNKDLMVRVVGSVGQQAVERIDRTRALAAKTFHHLLHHKDPVLEIAHRDELIQLFPAECQQEVMWSSEVHTFSRFVQLLKFPCYTKPVLEGFIMSIGGLTERLVKHSSSCLFAYLKATKEEECLRICNVVLEIFEKEQEDVRVMPPLLSFLDRLLGSGVVRPALQDPHFPTELLRLCKLQVSRSRDFRKLVSTMDVFCQLIQVEGNVSKRSLCQMTVFLCNRLKAVRKAAASKLYEGLLVYGDESCVPPDNLDEAMSVISDTDWEQDVDQVRPIRNQLCELMNVPVPAMIPRVQS